MTICISRILFSSVACLSLSAFAAYAQGGASNGKETQARAGETVQTRAGGVLSGVDTDYTRGAQNINQEDTLSGVRYGGGMEVAASEKILLRVDYTYTDYEDYDVNYVTGVDTFNPTETMVRLGVGLRF